jgi:hypothetical protein
MPDSCDIVLRSRLNRQSRHERHVFAVSKQAGALVDDALHHQRRGHAQDAEERGQLVVLQALVGSSAPRNTDPQAGSVSAARKRSG